MYLFLDWLEYDNFMGGSFRVEFGKSTNIFGANGTGKSRFKDAYSWLITGRNAADEAKFNIKDTINTENNILPHRVTAGFSRRPGSPITFEKSYIETWGNVQGEAEKKMTGNKIIYKIDGNTVTATEYKKIMDTLIPAELLKMLSDPLYFPDKLEWEDQRNVLELMAHDITNEFVLDRIATPEKDYAPVLAVLNAKSDLETRKGRIDYEIGELKKQHTPIQPKIEENTLQIKNIGVIQVEALNAEIATLQTEIEVIDKAITSKSEAEDLQADTSRNTRNKLAGVKNRQSEIENSTRQAYTTEKNKSASDKSALEDRITSLKTQKQSKESLLKSLQLKKTELDASQAEVVKQWTEENEKEFPEWDKENFVCDKCNRKHETEDIDAKIVELEKHFIDNKALKLENLNTQWRTIEKDKEFNETTTQTTTKALEVINADLATEETKLTVLNQQIAAEGEIKSLEKRLLEHAEYQTNIESIKSIEKELAEVKPIDYGELKTQKADLNSKIDIKKAELAKEGTIKYLQDRNVQLAADEKRLAQQIADYQREKMLIDEFIIKKSEIIQETIKSKFSAVTFKMFKTNIGDTIPKPACELWYEGKPWKALNTGSKLNAGLDVVNALSTHYGIFPPLLLDNRESVHDVLNVESQTINFFVNKEDKVLRVENN